MSERSDFEPWGVRVSELLSFLFFFFFFFFFFLEGVSE